MILHINYSMQHFQELDKDIEIDIDKELDLYRKTYGKYKNVYLNDEEYNELKNILV